MDVLVERALPALPAAVWPWITDPERMNAWSLARVTGLVPGPGGTFGETGATRRVVLPLPLFGLPIEEVILRGDAPTHLAYAATKGLPAKHHRGEIALTESGTGTLLRWHVRALAPPGLSGLASAWLRDRLGRSLDRLAGCPFSPC